MIDSRGEYTKKNIDSTVFSTLEGFAEESRKSSITKERDNSEELTNNRCVLGKRNLWKIFKLFVFLSCLTCLIIQAAEFYDRYNAYPTNIVLESHILKEFELPAITFCYRNSISAEEFCSQYPLLCERPNNLEEFCRLHSNFCTGNVSALVIPKHGYFTDYSREVEETAQRLLLNETDHLLPVWIGRLPPKVVTSFFQIDTVRSLKCYSVNLHLDQCSTKEQKPATLNLDYRNQMHKFVGMFQFQARELETFFPWEKISAMLDVHSPYAPTDMLNDGEIIKSGNFYLVTIQIETEERLLPPPYQTNCEDYTVFDSQICKVNNTTNPSSYQICLDLCTAELSKECFGCDSRKMIFSPDDLCQNAEGDLECEDEQYDELQEKLLKCENECKPDCRKLTYKYKVRKWRNENFQGSKNLTGMEYSDAIFFHVKGSGSTLLRHVPLYGKGELFSNVGGLIGCWLGISVWTFTGIVEELYGKAMRLRMEKRL